MIEQWEDIPNYENLYQISNLGRIKSLYNNNYGTRQQRVSTTNKLRKQVYKYDLKGNLLKVFFSLKETSKKENINMSTLSLKCRNMTDYKGYIYSYKEVV